MFTKNEDNKNYANSFLGDVEDKEEVYKCDGNSEELKESTYSLEIEFVYLKKPLEWSLPCGIK